MKKELIFRNIISIIVIIFSLLFILSCNPLIDNCCNKKKGPGSIVLTFDDKYIDSWYKADSIFSKYNLKATFCVTQYETLTDIEKQKLFLLQENGHEIASHGMNHFNSLEYLSNHTMQNYVDEEILASINKMTNDGLNINSFAYPGGVRSVELDLALFDYFSVLRGTTYDPISSNNQACFLIYGNDELLVKGLGIDSHYEHFDIDYIMGLVQNANEENIALILYGHDISDDSTDDYVTSYDTLENICQYVIENNMEFLTLSELITFNTL